MSNKTEVINRALIKIGANTIASPDEASEQARKALIVFETVAQNEMRRHIWNFAKTRATLAPLASPPGGGDFNYGFNLPGDCLRLVSLNGNWVFQSIREGSDDALPYFTIEGRTLLTNDGSAAIVYIADKSADVPLWDAAFVEAFACRLAAELVQSIAKNMTLKTDLKNDYKAALQEAKRTNAIELPPQVIADGSWVLARYW